MRTKNMRTKNKKLLLFVTLMIAYTMSTDVYAQTKALDIPFFSSNGNVINSRTGEYTVVPFADIVGWRYKAVDGKMYRRQYNYSKQQWIGEWELC
ncbi:hypothetical protein [Candidatus Galacturonibacter soehngenii]|uniref:WG repeat-containing protein n=1 Tax=Candidatus Galacturonatibacter soehngenii TaxID=2307010 RepID=A0A7V7QJY1_9FIRM|nr:hypothetical protein [Candidatus Galacturonibacter soehngenii]KAB1438029.1 hypothetical protein F7O84_10655 [Candidatus Galacturonibacter soehngenii]